jgi:transcriptional/translational regulatory protein YebC/TACO1
MLPKTYVSLDRQTTEQALRLVETLEDNEDVQNVYFNFEIPDEAMAC